MAELRVMLFSWSAAQRCGDVENGSRAALGMESQPIDKFEKKVGAKLGIATFLPALPRLSDRMYKICTLLSTGFVDNRATRPSAAARKALCGAGFRAIAGPQRDRGR